MTFADLPIAATTSSQRSWNACIILCLAFLCSQLSFWLRPQLLPEMLEDSRQILRGNSKHPEFQNRVLAPVLSRLVEIAGQGHISERKSWKAIRLFSAIVAFATLYRCVTSLTGSRSRGMAACYLMAYGYIWTPMTHAWEHSEDFFDIASMTLMVLFAIRGRVGWLLLLTMAAAFNRESAAFGGVILGGQAILRPGMRRLLVWAFLCTVVAVIMVDGIRYVMSGHHTSRQMLGILQTFKDLPVLWSTLIIGIAMFLPVTLAAVRQPRPWTSVQYGLLLACATITVITCVFGILGELRVLLPTYVLIVYMACMSSQPEDKWLRSLAGG